MKISDNFYLSEFTKSNTAKANNIDNSPHQGHIYCIKALVNNILQPLRDGLGQPIFISSGYRSSELNELINGSKNSQHSKGQAVDIDQDNRNSKISNSDVFFYILDNLDFDQLIWEFGDDENPDWVHVSYNGLNEKQRKEIIVAYKDNGKTKYKEYA